VENNRYRLLLLGGSLFLAAVAVCSLNLPQLFFEPFPLWYRVLDQVLLVFGLLGSVVGRKAFRFMGWTGICLFVAYVTIGSVPSLDHPAFDPNGEQRPELWMTRLALWLVLSASLAFCFRKVAARS
jgi:hypothetical protein